MFMVDTFFIQHKYKGLYNTQDEFATKSGMTRRTLSTILKTGKVKKKEYLIGMALALGVEESALLTSVSVNESVNQSGRENRQTVHYKTNSTGDDKIKELEKQLAILQRENELLNEIVKLRSEKKD